MAAGLLFFAPTADAADRSSDTGRVPDEADLASTVLAAGELEALVSRSSWAELARAVEAESRDADRVAETVVDEAVWVVEGDYHEVLRDCRDCGAIDPYELAYSAVWGLVFVVGQPEVVATSIAAGFLCDEVDDQCMDKAAEVISRSTLVSEALVSEGAESVGEWVAAQPVPMLGAFQIGWTAVAEYGFFQATGIDMSEALYAEELDELLQAALAAGGISEKTLEEAAEATKPKANWVPAPCSDSQAGQAGGPFGSCEIPGASPMVAPGQPGDPSPVETASADLAGIWAIPQLGGGQPSWLMPGNCFGLDPANLFDGTVDPDNQGTDRVVKGAIAAGLAAAAYAGSITPVGAGLAIAGLYHQEISNGIVAAGGAISGAISTAVELVGTYGGGDAQAYADATGTTRVPVDREGNAIPSTDEGYAQKFWNQNPSYKASDIDKAFGSGTADKLDQPGHSGRGATGSQYENPESTDSNSSLEETCGASLLGGLVGCMFPTEAADDGAYGMACFDDMAPIDVPGGGPNLCGCLSNDTVCVQAPSGFEANGIAGGTTEPGSVAYCAAEDQACPTICQVSQIASAAGVSDIEPGGLPPECDTCGGGPNDEDVQWWEACGELGIGIDVWGSTGCGVID
jgi:hypothetical protein